MKLLRKNVIEWLEPSAILVLCAGLSSCSDPFGVHGQPRAYSRVATGGEHTCALSVTGDAYCWGRGSDGELGTGSFDDRMTPAKVVGNLTFKDITAGDTHSCALTTNGVAHCWGGNADSQRGHEDDARASEPMPVQTPLRFTSISAGARHTCALGTDSLAYCWGWNEHGQLGDGTTDNGTVPIVVGGGLKFIGVTSGTFHSCGVTSTGAAYCWGANDFGQLGTGSKISSTVPLPVAEGLTFAQVDAGTHHTCGTTVETRFYCWGSSEYGEAGNGSGFGAGQPGWDTPVEVLNFPVGTGVFAGSSITCAMAVDGVARCWGRGLHGQLGNGANSDNYYPQPVLLFRVVVQFTSFGVGGWTHTCGIIERSVYCWGTGLHGQLGVAKSTYAGIPQRVQD